MKITVEFFKQNKRDVLYILMLAWIVLRLTHPALAQDGSEDPGEVFENAENVIRTWGKRGMGFCAVGSFILLGVSKFLPHGELRSSAQKIGTGAVIGLFLLSASAMLFGPLIGRAFDKVKDPACAFQIASGCQKP